MYIEKLEIRGFGKLSGLEFEFRKGLNLIYGRNESGKTTLQNFIKAMLYGLKGGKPAGDGLPAPGKRFRPWNGGGYGGTMEYRLDSGLYFRVERDFERNTAYVYDDHFNDITGDFLQGRDRSLNLAERHMGLNEACFEKTVFIRQLETRFDEDDGAVLSGRLANAGETGFEDVSFKSAQKALKDALINRVGTDRSSVRPLDRINGRLEELEALRASHRAGAARLQQARAGLRAATAAAGELSARRDFLGKVKKLIEARGLLEAGMAAESSMKDCARRIRELEAKIGAETAEVEKSAPFAGKGPSGKAPGPPLRIVIAVSAALLAVSALAAVLGQEFAPYSYGASLLLLAASAVLPAVFVFCRRRGAVKKTGGGTEADGGDRLARLLRLKDRQKELYNRASLACGRGIGSLRELRKAVEEAAASIAQGEKALESTMGSIRSTYAGRPGDPFDPEKLEAVIYDSSPEWLENTINAELEQAGAALEETALKIREQETLLRNGGSDDEALQGLDEEEALLGERKLELERSGAALRLALEVLDEAASEIRKSLTPMLEKKLGFIAGELTCGRYSDLRVDDRLELKAVLPETGGVNGARLLSGGTVDQLYLALRLAMAGILAPEGESLPVFMDEVFSQFDDIRIEQAVKYLSGEYGDRQALLFTCKERELEAAREICGGRLNLLTL